MEADQVEAVGPDDLEEDDSALPMDAEHSMQPPDQTLPTATATEMEAFEEVCPRGDDLELMMIEDPVPLPRAPHYDDEGFCLTPNCRNRRPLTWDPEQGDAGQMRD